jgi:hypothetical protein
MKKLVKKIIINVIILGVLTAGIIVAGHIMSWILASGYRTGFATGVFSIIALYFIFKMVSE